MIVNELQSDRSRNFFLDSSHFDRLKACYSQEGNDATWDADDKQLIRDLVRMNQLKVGALPADKKWLQEQLG